MLICLNTDTPFANLCDNINQSMAEAPPSEVMHVPRPGRSAKGLATIKSKQPALQHGIVWLLEATSDDEGSRRQRQTMAQLTQRLAVRLLEATAVM